MKSGWSGGGQGSVEAIGSQSEAEAEAWRSVSRRRGRAVIKKVNCLLLFLCHMLIKVCCFSISPYDPEKFRWLPGTILNIEYIIYKYSLYKIKKQVQK